MNLETEMGRDNRSQIYIIRSHICRAINIRGLPVLGRPLGDPTKIHDGSLDISLVRTACLRPDALNPCQEEDEDDFPLRMLGRELALPVALAEFSDAEIVAMATKLDQLMEANVRKVAVKLSNLNHDAIKRFMDQLNTTDSVKDLAERFSAEPIRQSDAANYERVMDDSYQLSDSYVSVKRFISIQITRMREIILRTKLCYFIVPLSQLAPQQYNRIFPDVFVGFNIRWFKERSVGLRLCDQGKPLECIDVFPEVPRLEIAYDSLNYLQLMIHHMTVLVQVSLYKKLGMFDIESAGRRYLAWIEGIWYSEIPSSFSLDLTPEAFRKEYTRLLMLEEEINRNPKAPHFRLLRMQIESYLNYLGMIFGSLSR
jgi:hypothetical protein